MEDEWQRLKENGNHEGTKGAKGTKDNLSLDDEIDSLTFDVDVPILHMHGSFGFVR